jgi:pyruvate formate lyase activating enzyme
MACFSGCPYNAREAHIDDSPRDFISITVDEKRYSVAERTTVKRALESIGIRFGIVSNEGDLQAPCQIGGCYACEVLVNGEAVRACVTPIEKDAEIETKLPENYMPKRIIHGPQPHTVGGKATPWWLKARGYIEVAIWAAGCNLRCPQCQNYHTTYDGRSEPLTPHQAARLITLARRKYGVHRMAISGGEPALNRPWLIRYFKELKRLNPDREARLHLDSNGTVLTKGFLDELIVDCGVTDIGIEPKGLKEETFMRITGIDDKKLVRKYQSIQWQAIRYIADNYFDRVFLGVGLPYNSYFIDMEEVCEFGEKLANINPDIQLCVLDYFPIFRRRNLERPSVREMLKVKEALNGVGLKTVIVQTERGHIGP